VSVVQNQLLLSSVFAKNSTRIIPIHRSPNGSRSTQKGNRYPNGSLHSKRSRLNGISAIKVNLFDALPEEEAIASLLAWTKQRTTPRLVLAPVFPVCTRPYRAKASGLTCDFGHACRWFTPGEPPGAAIEGHQVLPGPRR